jgi:hypothetical protein
MCLGGTCACLHGGGQRGTQNDTTKTSSGHFVVLGTTRMGGLATSQCTVHNTTGHYILTHYGAFCLASEVWKCLDSYDLICHPRVYYSCGQYQGKLLKNL